MSEKRKLEIIVLSGVSAGDVFSFELGEGDSITIGRGESCNIALNDPTVSRTHAGVIVRGGQFQIQDLGSAGGTTHMGFALTSGADGARALTSGDEFKIGTSLFRAQFASASLADAEPSGPSPHKQLAQNALAKFASLDRRRKRFYALTALACVLLIVLLLIPEEKKALPKQTSDVALELPEYRLLGYWPATRGTPPDNADSAHLDKVQFYLPTSNAIIEFDYVTEAEVEVFVEGVKVSSLVVAPDGWRHGAVIVRDVLEGRRRVLVFDNKEYPKKGSGKNFKRWGVKNVRATPITRPIEASLDKSLAEAGAQGANFDKSADGLFRLIRSLQRCVLEQSIESGVDAVGLLVAFDDSEMAEPRDGEQIQGTLLSIRNERRNAPSAETSGLHLQAMAGAISKLEGELWRRFNSRIRQALFGAKSKNSIVVYDNLVAAKAMFSDETDFRWLQADKMLNDKKLVPKNVLSDPERYR